MHNYGISFEVLTAIIVWIVFIWTVKPCILVGRHSPPWSLHGVTIQKTKIWTHKKNYVHSEALTAMPMKSTLFFDVTRFSPIELHRRFGYTYCLHPQGRVSQANDQQNASMVSCLVYYFTLMLGAVSFSESSRRPDGVTSEDRIFRIQTVCLLPDHVSAASFQITPRSRDLLQKLVTKKLWNLELRYRAHTRMSLFPTLIHMNPVQILTLKFLKVNFNIIVPSTLRSLSKMALAITFMTCIRDMPG
jgi:hypothetical protein